MLLTERDQRKSQSYSIQRLQGLVKYWFLLCVVLSNGKTKSTVLYGTFGLKLRMSQ